MRSDQPKQPKEAKNRFLHVRLNETEGWQIDTLAEMNNFKPSAYLKRLLWEAARKANLEIPKEIATGK